MSEPLPAAQRHPAFEQLYDIGHLDGQLAGGEVPLEAFRQTLKDATAALRARFDAGAPPEELVFGRSWLIDQLLTRAWRRLLPELHDTLALVAVGGYGRGELHPCSDIDLMILLPDGARGTSARPVESFLAFLWDMGLEVGHSVRTVDDCVELARQDITVATNLMEARLLAGAPSLFEAMRCRTGPDQIWPSRAFFQAKWREQLARHHKYHDTAYNLEPNIKEGPGGLRDIQMIGWVAKRHFGAETLAGLVDHDFLTQREYQSLREGQDFLWHIRFALHTLTGRREDRLLFDYQRTLAERLGYSDSGPNLAVEQLMKRYYRTIMELNRLNEMLLQLFQEAILYAEDMSGPVPINRRFQARKGFIETVHEEVFQRYPFALLEIFLLLAQHQELKGVRAATIRQIRNHSGLINDDFRNDLRARSLFMEIIRQPHGVTHELRRMNRYGVLAAYLPEFGHIVGQMQYDLFHVYTVDEHTLFVVRNLRRFSVPEYADEFPLCSQLAHSIPKPELATLAALFHDIAKGRGGDHSELGAAEAEAFCRRHGLSAYDSHLVSWLVRNHLILSVTAQRRDISDPLVINDFARQVGDRTRLDYLYLLTVADIRATNPELWNSWKEALLEELYTVTKRALRRGLEHPLDQNERIREAKAAARRLLAIDGVTRATLEAVWSDFSQEYFLRHTPDQIAWHTLLIAEHDPAGGPLVDIRQETERGGTEIFVYTRAENRLFALVTATLDQLGLTVADARIISSDSGHTLDTYVVLEASGEPVQGEFRAREILEHLARQLRHPDEQPTRVTRRAPRQFRHFPIATRVEFSDDPVRHRTAMELITTDRPGLLSRVGRAFADCGVHLHNAKIATFGARAEDVFYISDRRNRPLGDPEQLACLKATIIRYLDGEDAD
ncbi:MAG TPA: [protein-PII] uridylyltransferase [Gammaproteobacteria bacterium]|nr:[protein-PII] uridylyltransferase [Gammaproteobacteria bacterium]